MLRFGYDGSGYYGWARQPRLRTIEGEIRRGLIRHGIASSVSAARLEVASRTDRGVSAVANALTLSSPRAAPALFRSLNGIAPDIAFTAASEVSEGFRVRSATRRVYRYFEPLGDHDLAVWRDAAARFSGPIDVRSFGRALPTAEPVWRTLEAVTVTLRPGGAIVEVRAPSFVWGMVRKIVAALREVDAGRLSVEQLEAALHGRARLTLPLAEPERLVLWNVEFPLPWQHRWAGPNRHQSRWERAAREDLWVRQELLAAFVSGKQSDAEPEPQVRESIRAER